MNTSLRCQHCGNENPARQKYCSNCGQALQQPAAAKPAKAKPAAHEQPRVQPQSNLVPELPAGESGFFARVLRVVNRIFSLALRWIPRVPLYGRLAPFLGLNELTGIRPVFSLGALAITGFLGLYPSRLGHIDTTPFLYPIMALISNLNPTLGMISGVIFGIGDFAEKMVTNQVYYTSSGNIVDYLGARIGYIISYSAVIFTGLLPGVMSRAFRLTARKLFGGQASPPPGALGFLAFTGDSRVMEVAAGVVGGLLGGGLAGAAAIPLEVPAFMMRANPDISCYNLAVGNLTRGIPTTAIAGGAGGAVGSVTGGGAAVSSPAAPSSPASASPSSPTVTDQKVVSGQDAIDWLDEQGLHDGDCVPVPDHWSSSPTGLRGVGYTTTGKHKDPDKRCLDPSGIAITIDWTHPPGPTKTTSIKPGENIKDRIEDIYAEPPQTIETDEGTVVISPENFPDHVAGIGHVTKTVKDPNTGEKVVVIDPDHPVIIEHWDPPPVPIDPITIPPAYTDTGPIPDPIGPREPPEEPKPPPQPQKPPKQPQRKKMKTFRLRVYSAGDGGVIVGGGVFTVEIQEMPGGRFGRRKYFTFVGGGLTIGIEACATGKSDWVSFKSRQPACLEDFEGSGAIWVLLGAGLGISYSFGTHFIFNNANARCVMPSGWGWGVGAGITSFYVGWWEMR